MSPAAADGILDDERSWRSRTLLQTQHRPPPATQHQILHQLAAQTTAANPSTSRRSPTPTTISCTNPSDLPLAAEHTPERGRRHRRNKIPTQPADTAAMPTDPGKPRSPFPKEKRTTRSAGQQDQQKRAPTGPSTSPRTPPPRWIWDRGPLIRSRDAAAIQTPPPETQHPTLSTAPDRRTGVPPPSRRRRSDRRRREPTASPAENGGKTVASLSPFFWNRGEGERNGG